MIDQLSQGRFQLGVGRGVSMFETAAYGLDFAKTQAMYHEAFQVLMKGLTSDELDFSGEFYKFDKLPMILKPVQKPHPPLWYGVTLPGNAKWPAENDVNIVALGFATTPVPSSRPIARRARPTASIRTARSPASAATSYWPTPTRPRWRSRGAPIRAGGQASAGCSTATAPSPG